jgi:microcystin-dependent protein
MADQFVAEIRAFPFNFAPYGWAVCNGQLLPISQNTALFSLIGTYYGGNGVSTFGLPNMQGNIPIGYGSGVGLSPYDLGQSGGETNVTLLSTQMPLHTHGVMTIDPIPAPNSPAPKNAALGARPGITNMYTTAAAPLASFAAAAIGPAGGNLPHNNVMPFLTLNFCIALTGIFPTRP